MIIFVPQDHAPTLHNLNPRAKNVVLAEKEMEYGTKGDSNQKFPMEQ